MALGAASLSALVAFLVTTALTIFVLFFAVAFTIKHEPGLFQVSISAAVLDIVDLACLASCLLSDRFQTIKVVAMILAFAASHGLSLALLLWMQIQPTRIAVTAFGDMIGTLLIAAWALWGVSLTVQALILVIWGVQRPPKAVEQPALSRYTLARISSSWAPPSSDSLHITASPYFVHSNNSSPAVSSHFNDVHGPLRSPNTNFVRQITSRTRLALSPNASDTELGHVPSGSNGPSEHASSPLASPTGEPSNPQLSPRPATPIKQRLEPIPGSLPNSPAKILDGPFPEPAKNNSEMILGPGSDPLAAQDTMLREAERGRHSARIPPRFRKDSSSHTQSQPPSPAVDESHIHPLFRTDSPLPPPTPTVGTTITASAFGGQLISSRSLSRTGSRSGQTTPESDTRSVKRRHSGSNGVAPPATTIPRTTIKRARSLGTTAPKNVILEDTENIPPGSSDGSDNGNSLDEIQEHTGIAM